MSSCFFSSRLKMRISPISVETKRWMTALPKEPVPPVTRRVLDENMTSAPVRRAGGAHALDHLRPGRGPISRRLAEAARIERSINRHLLVETDLRLNPVHVLDDV